MKIFISTLLILTSFQVFGIEVTNFWNEKNEKYVRLNCLPGEESACLNTCNNLMKCSFKETICRNCLGNSLKLNHFFKSLGFHYVKTFNQYSEADLFEILKSGNFVSLTAKSIYNHVTRFNALSLQRQFNRLCENQLKNPIVFFSQDEDRNLGEIIGVVCSDKENFSFHEMTLTPDIDVN